MIESMDREGKRGSEHSSATIRSVASRANVSIATVSRYLNRTSYISPDLTERIQAAMRDLNYVPITSARNLATRKTSAIGIMLENIAGDFFAPFLKGVEDEASEAGYALFTASTGKWLQKGDHQPPLGPQNTDGVLLFANSLKDEWIDRWTRGSFPLVIVQQKPPEGLSIPSVHIENLESVREAVKHLIEVHGRKRIVFLKGDQEQEDAVEREQGYRRALTEKGLPLDPALILEGSFSSTVASASVLEALERGLEFDAVFAADDDSALGALQALRKKGYRVPEDVSLFGFDDQRYCLFTDPTLSTVQAPTEEVGRTAARSLLSLIRGEVPPLRIALPSTVIYRRSCGCLDSENSPFNKGGNCYE